MKHKCPNCGHRFDDNAQAKAAKERWKRTSKKDRSAEMRRIALLRHAKTKKATGPQNTNAQPAAETPEGKHSP